MILPNKVGFLFKTISCLVAGIFLFAGILTPKDSAADAPSAPSNLTAVLFLGKVNLTWQGACDGAFMIDKKIGASGYVQYAVVTVGNSTFQSIVTDTLVIGANPGSPVGPWTFTDPKVVAGATYSYRIRAVSSSGESSAYSNVAYVTIPNPAITNDKLLDQTEALACGYFYEQILTTTDAYGLVRDTCYTDYSSIAATGFGLSALCVMADRYNTTPDWPITPAQARQRANATLDTLIRIQGNQFTNASFYGKKGFFFHFIGPNGKREISVNSEVSTVDTAILLAGVLTAGKYFGGDVQVKADTIFNAVNWSYFFNPVNKQFYHGWDPTTGMIRQTWDRPSDETLIVNLLALASDPANADLKQSYFAFPRVRNSYVSPVETFDVYNSYSGSLFTYIFAHCWFDFEELGQDIPSNVPNAKYPVPVNWWENSVTASHANRQYCIDNAAQYASYGEDSWGLSACFRPDRSYFAMNGAPPREYVPPQGGEPANDGTVPTHAAICTLPFMKEGEAGEGLAGNLAYKALRHYYDNYCARLWGPYGPHDSFNHLGKFSDVYAGIDIGPMILMIENYRTGFIWNTFMQDARIVKIKQALFADTAPPIITGFSVTNPASTIGYAVSPLVNVILTDYDAAGTVVKWLITETSFQPSVADFNTMGLISRPAVYTINDGDGLKNLYAWAMDNSSNISALTANSQTQIRLDTTPPSMGRVILDGRYATSVSQLHATWSAQDPESGVVEYQYRITDRAVGGPIIRDWTSAGAATQVTAAGLSLIKNHTYYFSAKARNAAGLWSNISSSSGITLIQAAPSIVNLAPGEWSLSEVGDVVPFDINAADPEGDTIKYKIVVDGRVISDWNDAAVFDWNTASETLGAHAATVYVKDVWGNVASREISVYIARRSVDMPTL